ncbi:hypothetical protein [Solibacillus sp. CAU 1738]|uniref:hypothetical protein n=1 Tax=Solibacillus sp. CAU 1738 TaxID=3140363 RepID=UPI0032611A51
MWKGLFIASMLGTVLLAGCNTNNEALNHETPMQDVRNGVNDVIDHNNVRDYNTAPRNETVNPNTTNPVNPTVPGTGNGVNNGTINNGVNGTTTDKYVAPNGTVEERVIEKNGNGVEVDVHERNNVNNK